jgi:hypothetical protein
VRAAGLVELVMRDFVRTWYPIISTDEQCELYIRYLLTNAIGALCDRIGTVKVALFLCDDVCEALRHHLKWYSEMCARAARQRPGAFRSDSGSTLCLRWRPRLGLLLLIVVRLSVFPVGVVSENPGTTPVIAAKNCVAAVHGC